jgi:quinol monooxygenase YgiN
MQKTAQSYSSGEWLVRAGSEEEFVQRWTIFIEWSSNNAPGAVSFVLVRSTEEPRKFLSLGAWENQAAQDAWREMPRMQELLGQCRELCEEFEAHGYTLAASPGSDRSGTERAAQTIQEGAAATGQTVQGGVTATGQTVGGLLGAATGAVTDLTAGTVGAAAEGTERAVEAVAFPIEDYDEMNVDEISARLNDLSVEELQLVRDYEELNKRRESLLERMDRKIRAA